MFLRAIYIFPRSVHHFSCSRIGRPIVNGLQKHEFRNWERGCAVSFVGICVSNFQYSVFAVQNCIQFHVSKQNVYSFCTADITTKTQIYFLNLLKIYSSRETVHLKPRMYTFQQCSDWKRNLRDFTNLSSSCWAPLFSFLVCIGCNYGLVRKTLEKYSAHKI